MTPLRVILGFLVLWPVVGFLLSRVLRRNDLADLLWGSGIAVLVGAVGLPTIQEWEAWQRALVTLVLLWGLRLSVFLSFRNLPEPEDSRYAAWRKQWGKKEPLYAFFQVFGLQAVLAVGVALPALLKVVRPETALVSLGAGGQRVDLFFVFVAAAGLVIETVADAQLFIFRRRRHADRAAKKGEHPVLRSGLWAWSRHPNYFGETLFWWGITGIGFFGLPWMLQLGSLLGAALITFLLLRVSGVPMTEKGMGQRRGEEYRRYLAETSTFWLIPPCVYRYWKRPRE